MLLRAVMTPSKMPEIFIRFSHTFSAPSASSVHGIADLAARDESRVSIHIGLPDQPASGNFGDRLRVPDTSDTRVNGERDTWIAMTPGSKVAASRVTSLARRRDPERSFLTFRPARETQPRRDDA